MAREVTGSRQTAMRRDAPWFPYSVAPERELRVFCFAGAGGVASLFLPFREAMSADRRIDVVPVELPGRGTRLGEASVPSYEVLVDELVEAISAHDSAPFAFVGYCMGGETAMRITRALQDRGAALPEYIGLIAVPSPLHTGDELAPLADDALDIEVLLRRTREAFPVSRQAIFSDDDYMRSWLIAMRTDIKMKARAPALPATKLPVPMSYSFARDDVMTPLSEVRDWEPYAERGFRLVEVPGDHFFLFSPEERAARTVFDELRADLVVL